MSVGHLLEEDVRLGQFQDLLVSRGRVEEPRRVPAVLGPASAPPCPTHRERPSFLRPRGHLPLLRPAGVICTLNPRVALTSEEPNNVRPRYKVGPAFKVIKANSSDPTGLQNPF